MRPDSRIFVAGSGTLVGAALIRQLEQAGFHTFVGVGASEPDLRESAAVDAFFGEAAPQIVFMAAGESGGISANQRRPADLMVDNMLAATHVIHSAYTHHVEKLIYLAAACVYPKLSPQPMRPESLLTGPFEPTNEAYATAKMAGLKLCESYRAQFGVDFVNVIPANPFGVGDDFSAEDSHVIGALISRMHSAKQSASPAVEIWGTGAARRDFIYADDLAEACIFIAQNYSESQPINAGSGDGMTIKELAMLIREVVGYSGELVFNTAKPDGMPLKVLDSSILFDMGWHPRTALKAALEATYQHYLQTQQEDDLAHA